MCSAIRVFLPSQNLWELTQEVSSRHSRLRWRSLDLLCRLVNGQILIHSARRAWDLRMLLAPRVQGRDEGSKGHCFPVLFRLRPAWTYSCGMLAWLPQGQTPGCRGNRDPSSLGTHPRHGVGQGAPVKGRENNRSEKHLSLSLLRLLQLLPQSVAEDKPPSGPREAVLCQEHRVQPAVFSMGVERGE